MSSGKSEDDDEHDAISKQIVDYYKKYSQSKQLPKYFSGTSLSYMPPIVSNEEITSHSTPIIIIDDTNSKTLVEKPIEEPSVKVDEHVEPKAVSPTSSITSNRKLEWDNGADIGYNNCNKSTNLYKSTSLPILLSSVDSKKIVDKTTKTKLSSQIITVISYLSGDDDSPDKKQTLTSSSSSSSYPADVPIESSSSSVKTNPKPVSTSSSSSSITSTLAYLKSKIGSPEAESTPKVGPDVQFYIDTPIVPKPKKKIKHRSINLCVTKPIVIRCLDNQKKGYDKNIQTSFAGVSKSIQTSHSLEILTEKPKKQVEKPLENQSVILITYDSESDKRTCSSNTQTDDRIIVSQCDSFEYYRKGQVENTKNDSKRSSSKSNLAISTDSSKDIPILGQLITEQQSASLIRDVDRSIELLQKLLKSKKYDAATKKRYIKKIVDKIVNTKYSEDSTTSSELFVPKRQNDDVFPQKESVPWQPPPLSKLTVKTFSEEFLPSDTGSERKKRSVLTVTHGEPSILDTVGTRTSLEKQKNLSSGSCQSWKDDKTESEKLLEEKHRGQGDQLVKFAKKERQHQIAWINDEISHLTKLKGLLEKKVQRTTTVYMVSQQHCDCFDKNSCSCSGSQNTPPRNYVIETEVSSSGSSGVPVDYNLYDKWGNRRNYNVREIVASADINPNKKVVRDIEVVSDDKTTNIKVGAKKREVEGDGVFKPKPPTLIGTGKYDTFPRSKAESDRCQPCGLLKPVGKFNVQDQHDTKQFSFDVELNSQTNFAQKIQDIINKYTKEKSTAKFGHPCRCIDVLKSARDIPITESTSQFSHKLEEKISPTPTYTGCKCQHHTIVPNGDTQVVTHLDTKESEPLKRLNPKIEPKISQTSVCTCCKCQGHKISLNGDAQVTIELESKETEPLSRLNPKLEEENGSLRSLCPCCTCKENKVSQTTVPKTRDVCTCCSCADANTMTQGIDNIQCQTDDCFCSNKQIQTDGSNGKTTDRTKTTSESSSGSSTSETVSSTTQSVRSCLCCKRKNVTEKRLYSLRKKLSDEVYPLCRPCYRQNRMGAYSPNCYTNTTHVCNCYTAVKTKTLNQIKTTINDLNKLEEYCTCINPDDRNTSDYCKYCKCKLKQTSKNKNGIAYMLTFDETLKEKQKKHKKPYLEEIKIKIPVSYKKKRKDKENKRKKARQTDDSEASSSGVRKKAGPTLQEYLVSNRPNFVEGAEERRRTVNDTRAIREEMSDYNKLIFLKKCQEECEKRAKRLFSAKEMKEITKRNYKKLPEVQQRLNDNRERQLRQANRLMADTFNKKLRENVLKGKRNLSTSTKVIDM